MDEQWQREKENLHKRIIELERKLDAKQALELEIDRMRGALQVMKHMRENRDMDMKIKMDEIQEELKEKEEELDDLEALNQALVVKERKSNDELQEARKKLISVRILVNVVIPLYVWNERSMEQFLCFVV